MKWKCKKVQLFKKEKCASRTIINSFFFFFACNSRNMKTVNFMNVILKKINCLNFNICCESLMRIQLRSNYYYYYYLSCSLIKFSEYNSHFHESNTN